MTTDPVPDPIQSFWTLAQTHANVGDLDVVLGKNWGTAMAPPAWTFGGSPDESDAMLALVLVKRKTATTSLLQEYEEDKEPLPRKGDLSIILDTDGIPQALIRTAEVAILPFGKLTPDQAKAEGEPDLESWRQSRRTMWTNQGYVIDDDTRIVWERFTIMYHA